MSMTQLNPPVAAALPVPPRNTGWSDDEWTDLDVSIIESGVAAEQLIRMTDDGCNSTCATACNSCP
ncbi:FxLD family lantipeptide [Nonomuraea phyllanthi]|uniref:FxLD family lantipeptide n=1 Tax=Nonomuraea phyllanthi TaxID=2219224 RepID=A0A5C4W9F4_9ACTN|nr:FxLD family lanthipeptide [Nonomuraea phyllanthi]KAB8192540.1 FxLD family lantipeptide [Nonomuraea phyllanthi]QFY08017.1 FxLD family lantipeptide [Nonomuraea phyllanthi]